MGINVDERVTRQNICSAAISLFNTKGYAGTSVREIAKKANVNISLISYYFNSKQGLLEHLMESFFEGYIQILQKAYELSERNSTRDCIRYVILELLKYQQENNRLARFAHRETTIDSVLTREIMTVYLRQEKFYWQKLFEKGFHSGEFYNQNIDFALIQLKAMLTMPFSNSQYVEEIFHVSPSKPYFIKKYSDFILHWLDERFLKHENKKRQAIVG